MYFNLLFLTLIKFLYSYKNMKIIYMNKNSYYNLETNIDKHIIIKHQSEHNVKNNPQNSTFYLPGIFEIFPELRINLKKNNFKFKKCKKDTDCDNPEVCCDNPLKKNDKFCCSGSFVGKHAPAYAF